MKLANNNTDDGIEPDNDTYEREPMVVSWRLVADSFEFVTIGVHIDPDDARIIHQTVERVRRGRFPFLQLLPGVTEYPDLRLRPAFLYPQRPRPCSRFIRSLAKDHAEHVAVIAAMASASATGSQENIERTTALLKENAVI